MITSLNERVFVGIAATLLLLLGGAGLYLEMAWLVVLQIVCGIAFLILLLSMMRKSYGKGISQVENSLQQIVGGESPEIPEMSPTWSLIQKRLKAITTYLNVMRQSMEDRISLLENSNTELKEQQMRTKEAYLALEHSNMIQSELRGLLDMDNIIEHTMRLLMSELCANKGLYFKADQETQCLLPISAIGLQMNLAQYDVEPLMELMNTLEDPEAHILALKSQHSPFYEVDFFSGLLARIVVDNELWGCIALFDKETREGQTHFAQKDEVILENVARNLEKDLKSAHLFELATVDGLSKLYVRRYFEKRLEEELKRSMRYDTPFSLLILDIDHFKRFNDTYGHLVGDEVIQQVAQQLKIEVRSGVDVVARYGGEEMVILLPQTPLDQAEIVAERIRKAIENLKIPSLSNSKNSPNVTVSIGVSSYPDYGSDVRVLLESADMGLYQAKESGRNQVGLKPLEEAASTVNE